MLPAQRRCRGRRGATRTPSPGSACARLETRVELLQAYTGHGRSRCVRASPATGARGLALVAFGRGNVPPPIMPALERRDRGGRAGDRLVALRRRPRQRRATATKAAACTCTQIGAMLAGDLSGAKARLLQMVALGLTGETRARRRD